MPQRGSQPLRWAPEGISDTLDTSEVFEGAMTLLQNLIPDPSTMRVWQCRPAALSLSNFRNAKGVGTFTLVGGSGYTNGSFNCLLTTANGHPLYMPTARITVAGGTVTVVDFAAVNFGSPGRGVQVGDVYTTTLLPGGSGFSITVTGLDSQTNSVGDISALLVVGDLCYGMVGLLGGVPNGQDVPFCFNLITKQFVPITGVFAASSVVGGNTPSSLSAWTPPATPAAWTPPHMELVGAHVVVTHVGFSGTGTNWVGDIDITNPTAPAWNSKQMGGAQTFSVVPSWVTQFNGRAYYIHNLTAQPAVFFSDALVPFNMTLANQILTFNDQMKLTAMGPLQLNNQLGGIVQTLMVFKGVANIYQITGDASQNSIYINSLNVATGTLAPNSITPTPKGLAFMAPDGYRLIDFQATVSDVVGMEGTGITVPFINAVVPSRVSSSCNGSVFRTTVQNGAKPGAPVEEYWYYFGRTWNGPHLFPISSAQFTCPSFSAEYNNTFICAYAGVPGTLWQSDYVQSTSSTFVENGFQMQWVWQTPNLPSAEQMGNIAMTETTVMLGFGVGTTAFGISAISPSGAGITNTQLTSQGSVTYWGSFNWGTGIWGGQLFGYSDRQVAWPIPIVSTRFSIQLNGNSAQGVKIGTMRMRYQPLKQLLTPQAGVP